MTWSVAMDSATHSRDASLHLYEYGHARLDPPGIPRYAGYRKCI
jgi:hypothetical protein